MDDNTAINFYTGFESYHVLHTCFQFLGEVINHYKTEDPPRFSHPSMNF